MEPVKAGDASHRCGGSARARQAARVAGAIRVEGLRVCFGASVALDDVTLSVPAGRLTMVVGPPGSGKTVLLKSLSCELPWGSGTIWIQDVPARLWPAKKKQVCVCTCPAGRGRACPFPDPAHCALARSGAFEHNTARTLVAVRESLELLGIEHLESRPGPTLTERDRSRLQLAFTIAPLLSSPGPQAVHLWLDDPLDGIDQLHQYRLLQWLKQTAPARHTTVITATDHALARVYADHVVLLAQGRLAAEGAPYVALAAEHLTSAFGRAAASRRGLQ